MNSQFKDERELIDKISTWQAKCEMAVILLDSLIDSNPPDLQHVEVLYQSLQDKLDKIERKWAAAVSNYPPLSGERSLSR